jgi:hypothetical protein
MVLSFGVSSMKSHSQSSGNLRVTITFSEVANDSKVSKDHSFKRSILMNYSADIIISGSVPEANGRFILNTENGSIISRNISGKVTETDNFIDKDQEGIYYKRNDEYSGSADPMSGSIEFEYNPEPDEVKGLVGAVIRFNKKGNYSIWKRDDGKSENSQINDPFGAYFGLVGGKGEVVKRVKNGFIIEGNTTNNFDKDEEGESSHSSDKIKYSISILIKN